MCDLSLSFCAFYLHAYIYFQKAQLRVLRKGQKDEIYDLRLGTTKIGRDPSQNDIVFDDPSLSKCHCELAV